MLPLACPANLASALANPNSHPVARGKEGTPIGRGGESPADQHRAWQMGSTEHRVCCSSWIWRLDDWVELGWLPVRGCDASRHQIPAREVYSRLSIFNV